MTTLQEMTARFEEARQELRRQAEEQGRPILIEAAKDLFAAGAEALRWRQYTPYFNDGDACEFSVSDVSVRVSSLPEDCGDYEDGFVDAWHISYAFDHVRPGDDYGQEVRDAFTAESGAEFKELVKDFSHLICQAEEFMEALFGDHVEITLRADGTFEVEDYEHD